MNINLYKVHNIQGDILDLEDFLEDCKKVEATDLHFFPLVDKVKVLARVTRGLEDLFELTREDYIKVIQKLKIRAGLNISEKRLPQDGIIRIKDEEVRISTLRTLYGEALTLRLFNKKVMALDNLGFNKEDLKKVRDTVKGNFSLILITGETGSGKSTTMKSLLLELSSKGRKIISIEDPVEISVPGVMEVNICESIGLDYERAIFAALRQDPDYISIGEIRDKKTCDSCIKAALSGHPVISTFHSRGYEATTMRLKSMTSYPEFISGVLTMTINQKLLNIGGQRKLSAIIELGKEYEGK